MSFIKPVDEKTNYGGTQMKKEEVEKMKKCYCPKCQGKVEPIYKNAYMAKDGYRTIDGAIAKPAEWLCENCRITFTIKIVGRF